MQASCKIFFKLSCYTLGFNSSLNSLYPPSAIFSAKFGLFLRIIILSAISFGSGGTGPRVIEQTIRQRLPKGFQSSEFLLNTDLLI